jgi:hypothetical protein
MKILVIFSPHSDQGEKLYCHLSAEVVSYLLNVIENLLSHRQSIHYLLKFSIEFTALLYLHEQNLMALIMMVSLLLATVVESML